MKDWGDREDQYLRCPPLGVARLQQNINKFTVLPKIHQRSNKKSNHQIDGCFQIAELSLGVLLRRVHLSTSDGVPLVRS
jgi:hypothetical protein